MEWLIVRLIKDDIYRVEMRICKDLMEDLHIATSDRLGRIFRSLRKNPKDLLTLL